MNVPGLRNSGNTCFFNGALQVVTHASTGMMYLRYVAACIVVNHAYMHCRH
jgi:ubiquitin C-terminal hydrolase